LQNVASSDALTAAEPKGNDQTERCELKLRAKKLEDVVLAMKPLKRAFL
jgi:hypothetical protein